MEKTPAAGVTQYTLSAVSSSAERGAPTCGWAAGSRPPRGLAGFSAAGKTCWVPGRLQWRCNRTSKTRQRRSSNPHHLPVIRTEKWNEGESSVNKKPGSPVKTPNGPNISPKFDPVLTLVVHDVSEISQQTKTCTFQNGQAKLSHFLARLQRAQTWGQSQAIYAKTCKPPQLLLAVKLVAKHVIQ